MPNHKWNKHNRRYDAFNDVYMNQHMVSYIELRNPVDGRVMRVQNDDPHSYIGCDSRQYQQEAQYAIDMLMRDPKLLFKFLVTQEDVLRCAIETAKKSHKFPLFKIKNDDMNEEISTKENDIEYEEALIIIEHFDENGIKDESDQEEYDLNLEIVKKYEKS